MKVKVFFKTAIVLFCLCSANLVQAQGNPGDDPDTGVPFDGGLSLLVTAAVGYGLKKAADKRKKERETEQTEK